MAEPDSKTAQPTSNDILMGQPFRRCDTHIKLAGEGTEGTGAPGQGRPARDHAEWGGEDSRKPSRKRVSTLAVGGFSPPVNLRALFIDACISHLLEP